MTTRSDNFNRANGNLSGSTPSDNGAAWSEGSWFFVGGPFFTIDANRATGPAGIGANAWLEVASAVADLEVTLQTFASGNGVILRCADRRSGILVYLQASGHTTEIYTLTGTAPDFSLLAFETATTWASGDVLKATVDADDLITVYQNGNSVLSVTDATGASNTKFGLAVNNGGMFWDGLTITDTSGGGPDELTADDAAAGTPTLGTPAIAQTHVLDASDLAAPAPVLTSAAPGQIHALAEDDAAAPAPSLTTPALGQTHVLAADDLAAGAPTLTSPVLAEVVDGVDALRADSIDAGAPELWQPGIGQPAPVAPIVVSGSGGKLRRRRGARGGFIGVSDVPRSDGWPRMLRVLSADAIDFGAPTLGKPHLRQCNPRHKPTLAMLMLV